MSEQKYKIPSIASSSPELAWNLLTTEQKQRLLEYVEKSHVWICENNIQKSKDMKNGIPA